MTVGEMERRLRDILFEACANEVRDIREPALLAEAGFLEGEIPRARAARAEARRASGRANLAKGRALSVARRHESRARKAAAVQEMSALGLSNAEIARRLDLAPRHVSRLRNSRRFDIPVPRCGHCGQPLPATEPPGGTP